MLNFSKLSMSIHFLPPPISFLSIPCNSQWTVDQIMYQVLWLTSVANMLFKLTRLSVAVAVCLVNQAAQTM